MSHSVLLQGSRMQLVNQLVYFDEEKAYFLDHYFPHHGIERSKVEQVLSAYTAMLENVVADLREATLNTAVLIGSEVSLRYAEDGEAESFTIVFPHLTEPGRNKISFLSPLGLQLLMKRAGLTYELAVPSGVMEVAIEAIKYKNCGDTGESRAYG